MVVELPRGPDGKRRQKWVTVKGSKRDAERALAEMIAQVERGEWADPGKLTVADFLRQWLAAHGPNLSPATKRRYEVAVEMHIIPRLGAVRLAKLTPAHVQQFLTYDIQQGRRDRKGKPGLHPATALYHFRVLHRALAQAVKWGLLARNPCDGAEPPRPPRQEFAALDAEQARAVLDAVRGTNAYMPALLSLATGMRLGEVLALRWEDVDLEAGLISVRRSLYSPAKGQYVFKEPKSASSRRAIEIGPDLAAALRRHRAEQARARLAAGERWQDWGLVCCREDGSPLLPQSVSSRFADLVRRAGIKVRFHDLRHAHATLLAQRGLHPKLLSARLGHSGVGITLDLYAHAMPGMQREAASWLESVLLRGPRLANG